MKDRLLIFMKNEGLTAGKLAEIVGVQPSAISHITSGRNKPGFDFLAALFNRFPDLNPRWMIVGEGEMILNTNGQTVNKTIRSVTETDTLLESQSIENESAVSAAPVEANIDVDAIIHEKQSAEVTCVTADNNKAPEKASGSASSLADRAKTIERIVFFHTDGTFSPYEQR